MPVTSIEVLDTAVKVGLGALISGLTTFLVARRAQSHEIRKVILAERLQLLREAAVKLEQGGSLINKSCEAIAVARATGRLNQQEKLSEELPNFIMAFNTLKESHTLFYLSGRRALGELVGEYATKQDEVRKHFIARGTEFDFDVLNNHYREVAAMKKEILNALATELNAFEA
ncbi:hypothetical protein [Roseateles microcysteis]|uniref:hypothetical protein n=1 Tax=Roseateles microcysteis TaxID=3119057 RepID=UPI002FE6066D